MPKQVCLGPCSNESSCGTKGRPGNILISAMCPWLPSLLMNERCLSIAKPGHVTLRLIRCLLITLIRGLLWAECRMCVPFLSTGEQSEESSRDSPRKHRADQSHLTSSYRSMGVMFGHQPASIAATGSQLTRPFFAAHCTTWT